MAADDKSDVVASVQKSIRDWNKQDIQAFKADMVEAPDIVDEFAPFHWSGREAISAWSSAYQADAANHKVTDATLTVETPRFVAVEGSSAYVVLPSTANYKQDGKPGVEAGTVTMSLQKVGPNWLISAFSWAKN